MVDTVVDEQQRQSGQALLSRMEQRQEFAAYLLGLGAYALRADNPQSEQARRVLHVTRCIGRFAPEDQEGATLRLAGMVAPSAPVLAALIVAAFRDYMQTSRDWQVISTSTLFQVALQHHHLSDFLSFSGLFTPPALLPTRRRAPQGGAPAVGDELAVLSQRLVERARLFITHYQEQTDDSRRAALRLVVLGLLEGDERHLGMGLAIGKALAIMDGDLDVLIRQRLMLAVRRGDIVAEADVAVPRALRWIAALEQWAVVEALPYLEELSDEMATRPLFLPYIRRTIAALTGQEPVGPSSTR